MRAPALRTLGQLQLRQLNSSIRPLHSAPLLLAAADSNSNSKKSKTKFLTDRPVKVDRTPSFPPPANPFAPKPEPVHYSDLTLSILWKINKLLGYNGRRRTTARESGRMMSGIIEAVKHDKVFWYDGEFLIFICFAMMAIYI